MRPLVLLRVSTLPFEALSRFRARRAPPLMRGLLEAEDALDSLVEALGRALHDAAGDRDSSAASESVRGRLAIVRIRRDVHNRRALRAQDLAEARGRITPGIAAGLEEYAALRRRCQERLRSCRDALAADALDGRRELLTASGSPLVAEGIWLASRSILSKLRALGESEPAAWGHGERHVAAKAAAYLARFCTKTSPNGLFCATAVVDLSEGGLAVEGHPGIERVDVILNVAEARKVASCLAADTSIERAVAPRPNPTLREADGAWTFWRPASPRNPTDDEVLCRAKDHQVLRLFLEEAGRGAHGVPELLEAVGGRCEAGREELERFYRQLVGRGILVAEVELPYNSRRPLRELAVTCRGAGCRPAWLSTVERVEEAVDALPALAPPERVEAMEEVGRLLEPLPHVRPLKLDELFRLDAASTLRVRLPRGVIDELRAALGAYVRLFTAMYPERLYRSALASQFLRKHPPDTDVEVLDLYHGLFEPKDVLRPASFPDPAAVAPLASGAQGAAAALRDATELLAGRARETPSGEEVRLEDCDLGSILGDLPEPRWSCVVLFQVAARGPEEVQRGRYRLVLSALFQGTGVALARFAQLHGGGASLDENPVVQELRRGWASVEREGALVAELTYNHNARTANAGLRPAIFRHEIELPGEKASPGAEVIPLRELVVRWDTARGRFVLRWTRRGVEVIPVINSGVNPVGVISFLVSIGQQDLQPLAYFPGFHAAGTIHWPRFTSGRLVVFRERWAFPAGELPAARRTAAPVDDADFFLEVARWRRRHRIPRHVFAHTSSDPKPRYLDLESPTFVDLLRRTLAARDAPPDLHLVEMLPAPEHLWIAGAEGHHACEFLVHLQKT